MDKRIDIIPWRLVGYDTFEGGLDAFYPLPGEFFSLEEVRKAACERLKELERTQPSEGSGGQGVGGIQDWVFIVDPDGNLHRFTG